MFVLSSNILKHLLCSENDPWPFAEDAKEVKGNIHAIKELGREYSYSRYPWGIGPRTLVDTKICGYLNVLYKIV